MASTIGDNDWVLLIMSSGERRLVQVRASSKIHIGQSHVSAAPLLGTPFGANFRLETEGKKQDHKLVVDKRTVEQIDGDVTSALADMRGEAGPEMKNNAVLNDDGSAQSMDEHAIKKMKLEGAQGETIVRALAQNSASFAGKTAFSQEKWMKKKAKRHLHHLTAARPTALTVVDMYTLKGPEKDGCPFVIYNPCVAPLADCMHYCQRHKLAVKLQLLEGFTRAYQVAPNRTHPTMNTYPPTGCVLSGVKVGAAAQPQPHT